jgi:DNA-binding response OmpR family regulator
MGVGAARRESLGVYQKWVQTLYPNRQDQEKNMAIDEPTLHEKQGQPLPDWQMQTKTILILMEGARMAALLSAYFDQEGYQVFAVKTNHEAQRVYEHIQPDVVITDQEVTRSGSGAFLFDNNQAIFTLIQKPAPYRSQIQPGVELVKRSIRPRALGRLIRAALHRAGKQAPEARIYRSGSVIINRDKHFVRITDRYINLTPTEFDILTILIASPGQTFTRAELRDRVLGTETQASERTIDVHMMNIRTKLATDPQEHAFIETVHRLGYRFNPD